MSKQPFVLKKNLPCTCGRVHDALVDDVVIGKGAIARLPELIARYGAKKAYLFSDVFTFRAAGEKVIAALEAGGIPYTSFVCNKTELKPDEYAAGAALMNFDRSCDIIIGIGSGVVNDTCKLLAAATGRTYFIVGTAPSMDGYASATSSSERSGVKVSLSTKCANVIIGDTDVLKDAPERMLSSGLGDMIAKYVSLCEWQISHIINGEYYCPQVAGIMRDALKKCVDHADGLLKREEDAIEAVFEGLILGGVAMNYAKVSRPASGVEHYFSHIWDMRGLEFGTPVDFHGIQCAIGTRLAIGIYRQLRQVNPDREKALAFAAAFDVRKWGDDLHKFLGKSADVLIELEKREGKFDREKHAKRLEIIISRWDEIVRVMDETLPTLEAIDTLLQKIGIPLSPAAIGLGEHVDEVFRTTMAIRDKYLLSRLCWDLGVIDEIRIEV